MECSGITIRFNAIVKCFLAFVLTRRGKPIAALVSIKELELLQEIEDKLDTEDAWKAQSEPGDPIPWEELKKELDI